MPWRDWVDVAIIRAAVRHTTGAVVVIALFWITGWAIKWFLPEGITRTRLEGVENVVLVALFIILGIILGLILIQVVWKQLRGGWNGTQVLAV